jgi:hypothetical protein
MITEWEKLYAKAFATSAVCKVLISINFRVGSSEQPSQSAYARTTGRESGVHSLSALNLNH